MLLLTQPKARFALIAARVTASSTSFLMKEKKDQWGGVEAFRKACRHVRECIQEWQATERRGRNTSSSMWTSQVLSKIRGMKKLNTETSNHASSALMILQPHTLSFQDNLFISTTAFQNLLQWQ